MTRTTPSLTLASALALAAVLAGCDSNDPATARRRAARSAPAPTPAPRHPTPTPTTAANFNVTPCLNADRCRRAHRGRSCRAGRAALDLNQPAGFPNGRRYLDPVIDVTLAVIFLDLQRHPATTFAAHSGQPERGRSAIADIVPVPGAAAWATRRRSGGAGTNFTFRSDLPSAYVRVDRAGMPAVSTALISGNPNKNAYNDDNPTIDATGKWVPELVRHADHPHQRAGRRFHPAGAEPVRTARVIAGVGT